MVLLNLLGVQIKTVAVVRLHPGSLRALGRDN